MKKILSLLVITSVLVCNCQTKKTTENKTITTPETTEKTMKFEITKTDEEWKKILTEEQFNILRQKGTERAFTGEYNKNYDTGTYNCAACDNPLFTSETKFDSHSGWPSFDDAIKGAVAIERDSTYGMDRVEILCNKCGGHLGHVFDDGPTETTGKRYCTNSASLKFIAKK